MRINNHKKQKQFKEATTNNYKKKKLEHIEQNISIEQKKNKIKYQNLESKQWKLQKEGKFPAAAGPRTHFSLFLS